MDLRDTILQGDVLDMLRTLPDGCVQTVVTSPPYWSLRDYGVPGQIGLEATPQEYVQRLVEVFREVRRVLRNDGTAWVNLGDSYFGDSPARKKSSEAFSETWDKSQTRSRGGNRRSAARVGSLKPKDLCGIPWRVAFALQDDGWWLRSDIVWAKSNPMPESVTDRPTRSHEYIFLLAKSQRYYYDAEAIRQPPAAASLKRIQQPNFANQTGGPKDYANGTNSNRSMRRALENWSGRVADKQRGHSRRHAGFNDRWDAMPKEQQQALGANKRDVWTVATRPYAEAHFATFPPKLIEPCILAGAPPGGLVLDPFMGSGSTGYTARLHSRHYLGIELNPAYIEMAERRIGDAKQPHLWTA